MRRIFSFLVLFFLSVGPISAQSEKLDIDSMANKFMRSEQIDLKTFDLLFIELHLLYPEELAHLAEVLLKRSIEKNFPDGIYRAHDAFGFYFISKGYYNQAFKLLFKSKKYYEANKMFLYAMKNYYYISRAYVALGNLDEAVVWMQKSMALAELNPDRGPLYNLNIDLATIFFRLSKFENGKKLLDKNDKEWEHLNHLLKVSQTTLRGNYAIQFKQSKEAKQYYDEALKLAFELDNPIVISNAFANLGIYEIDFDIEKSKDYFETSVKYAHLSNHSPLIARQNFNLASWYYFKEDYNEACKKFEESYTIAKNVKSYDDMLDALEEMINIKRDLQDWEAVDELHQKTINIKTEQYKDLMQSFEELELFEGLDDFFQINNENNEPKKIWISALSGTQFFIAVLMVVVILQFITIFRMRRKTSGL